MKTNKSKLLVLLTLAATFVLAMSCLLITACTDNGGDTCAIVWKLPDGVTASVEGKETLPETWTKDTDLTFTLDVPEGYNATVRAYNALSLNKDGAYSFKVTKDATITVTISKILNGITVTGFDADKQYFEDDQIATSAFTVTANYATGDEVVTSGISISYQHGQALMDGDTGFTVNFGGKSAEVKFTNPVKATLTFETTELVLDDDENPVFVIQGFYNAEGTLDEIEAEVIKFIADMTERGTWKTMKAGEGGFTAVATVQEDKSFELRLTMLDVTPGHQYFFHVKDGSDNSNFTSKSIINESVVIGDSNEDIYKNTVFDDSEDSKALTSSDGTRYYIGYCKDWNPDTIMVHIENEDAPKFVDANLEVKNDLPYLVLNGTGKPSEASLLKLINHLDMEDVTGNNAKVADYVNNSAIVFVNGVIIELDAENSTFKLYLLLYDDFASNPEKTQVVKNGANLFAHLGSKSGNYYPNLSLSPATGAQSITIGSEENEVTYSFTTSTALNLSETWQQGLLYIHVEGTPDIPRPEPTPECNCGDATSEEDHECDCEDGECECECEYCNPGEQPPVVTPACTCGTAASEQDHECGCEDGDGTCECNCEYCNDTNQGGGTEGEGGETGSETPSQGGNENAGGDNEETPAE